MLERACRRGSVGQAFLPVHSTTGILPVAVRQTGMSVLHIGTYVNGRRLPLQGRGWGFESLRAYQFEISDLKIEI